MSEIETDALVDGGISAYESDGQTLTIVYKLVQGINALAFFEVIPAQEALEMVERVVREARSGELARKDGR